MKKLKIYLDNCCFNRPFDDQSQIRIHVETEAKLYLQREIEFGNLLLIWSYILDYENSANPFEFRRTSISKWKKKANIFITENQKIREKAEELTDYKLKAKDALHIACALEANSDYFVTTDDKVINKQNKIEEIEILNPVDMLKVIED